MNTAFVKLDNKKFGEKKSMIKYISPKRQKKIEHYRYDIDKLMSLYGELVARVMLSKWFHRSPMYFNFEVSSLGKPYIKDEPSIFFNLSHTPKAILCAISDHGEVGVDIEKMGNLLPTHLDLIYHPNELHYLKSLPLKEQNKQLYKIWTRKEAYVKMNGTGIKKEMSIIDTLSNKKDEQYMTWEEGEYICSVCYSSNEKFNIEIISDDYIDKFIYSHN